MLPRIEEFLARMQMSPTRFGRTVVRDPRLVFDLRRGRQPRRKVQARVRSYLARCDAHERSVAIGGEQRGGEQLANRLGA